MSSVQCLDVPGWSTWSKGSWDNTATELSADDSCCKSCGAVKSEALCNRTGSQRWIKTMQTSQSAPHVGNWPPSRLVYLVTTICVHQPASWEITHSRAGAGHCGTPEDHPWGSIVLLQCGQRQAGCRPVVKANSIIYVYKQQICTWPSNPNTR